MKELDLYNMPRKKMIGIPLVILIVCIGILCFSYASNGSPVKLGYDFTGGTAVSVPSSKAVEEVEQKYQGYDLLFVREIGSRTMLQFGPMSSEKNSQLKEEITGEYGEDVMFSHTGAAFGRDLQRWAEIAVLMAFALMATIVFIVFRHPLPSFIIVFCAGADIIIAMAMMNVFGIELSLGTVAALLMLIGYSVDTDILLTNKVLKERKHSKEDFKRIFKTGYTMTTTSLAAIVVMFLVSTFSYLFTSYTQISILREISAILIFGLVADLWNTWLFNVGMLKSYIEKKGIR